MLVNLENILKKAKQEKYAVGLFNTIDTDCLEGVISAAEELNSPVIIGTAEVLLPFGELKLIAPALIAAAKRATVPVAVHFDHGLTFERCMEALQLGFSSVMFDGSLGGNEENLAQTREIVKIAHAFGVTVEGEIGHVGLAAEEDNLDQDRYTTVEEAKWFLDHTGVDALAIAIGTAHGAYKSKPKLAIDRLREIADSVDVPLVLHGGSGLTDDDFRNVVANGIAKVNIYTDVCHAGVLAMQKGLEEGKPYDEIRNEKVKQIKECVMNKMRLFGSENKA